MPRTALLLLLSTALFATIARAQAPTEPADEGHQHGAHGTADAGGAESPPAEEHALRHRGPADHSFADAENWAKRFESAERDAWQMPDRVVEAMGLEPGDSVADIGSGTGYFARRFAAAVGPAGTVYAADVEPGMAEYVRRRADEDGQRNLVPVLASYDDPRLPAGAVDLVFICNTWHHIRDRVDYARRLAGDLATGGRVAIVDFLPGELPVGPSPDHKLSAEQVIDEFRQAGFRPVATHDFLPYQYVLVFSAPSRSVDIRLAHGSEVERQGREQLVRLLETYDLEPWLFTREVVVDEAARIPHSHPILTLKPDTLDNDAVQLASFVHEQLHWFVLRDQERLAATIESFRQLFPEVPGGNAGARNEASTYLHLVVCDLELQAMTRLVGEEKGRAVLEGWNHYTWIYEQVLGNPEVRRVNERHGMVVP